MVDRRGGDLETLNLALALHQAGDLPRAAELYRQVLARNPKDANALRLLGTVEFQRGNLDQAQARLTEAAKLGAKPADAHYLLGLVLLRKSMRDDAARHLRECITLDARHDNARIALGCLVQETGDTAGALELFMAAAAINPNAADAWYNAGKALQQLGRRVEALSSYDRALAARPPFPEALNNRGAVLGELARYTEALASYDSALALRPGYAEAHNNRGVALLSLVRFADAVESFDRALAVNPRYAEALNNRGRCLMRLGRFEAAAADFDALLRIDPDYKYALGHLVHARMQGCDWRDLSALCTRLTAELRAGRPASSPFPLLAVPSSPSDQLLCARMYAADLYPAAPAARAPAAPSPRERLRIGYVSGEFREQATSYLIAELIETHDRSRFEVYAISSGPDDRSPMRRRLEAAAEHFVDISTMSDDAAAQHLRELGIDILINLNGYFGEERTGMFARRPAPLAVNYLGFPGTMGVDYIDYILADRRVIPLDEQCFYGERVVYLPDCYQVNDSKRHIAEETPTREEAGLPAAGFVFCCFNNNYKIMPEMFDLWMRLLHAVSGSALWLIGGNPAVERNLRREADSRGVAGERIVFAPRLALDLHLARHRLADLFLDTLPLNAHTTASDALWAGLPVLTCAGSTFAGRVAASLLDALRLPELICGSLADYEACAVELAQDAARLAEIRRRLASHRADHPLFDVGRFRRHIEAAFAAMWDRHRRGELPCGFSVSPIA